MNKLKTAIILNSTFAISTLLFYFAFTVHWYASDKVKVGVVIFTVIETIVTAILILINHIKYKSPLANKMKLHNKILIIFCMCIVMILSLFCAIMPLEDSGGFGGLGGGILMMICLGTLIFLSLIFLIVYLILKIIDNKRKRSN